LTHPPDIGRPYRSSEARLQGLRVLPIGRFRSYLVFYRRTDEEVEILRILHAARDVRWILDTEPP
jgi:toxin ParE1/3/4